VTNKFSLTKFSLSAKGTTFFWGLFANDGVAALCPIDFYSSIDPFTIYNKVRYYFASTYPNQSGALPAGI